MDAVKRINSDISSYLRFLYYSKDIQLLNRNREFGAHERELFKRVVLAWAEKKPMTVQVAMGQVELGSPVTLHIRLSRLRQMNLIETFTLDDDRRAKYLIPTTQGLEFIDRMDKAIALAVKE